MKKRFIVFFVFILLFFSPMNLFVNNVNASNNWIIDGDTVYIDDENVYLSATPHTLINDGVVVFELETESYDGDIDIAWGFDIPDCTPHNPQIWRNYTHEFTGYHYVDRIGNIEIYNVTGWVNLGIENYNNYTVDYGNINNTYLMNISYETNKTLIIAFTSYIEFGNGDDYRLTGHYDNYESYVYYETFFDWQTWNADFEVINYNYSGMNTWFLLKDIPVVHNYRYKVRAFIDIPINTIGKYWWVIKPSDKTIPESINEGTFYCLDPWWNVSYTYYKVITIDPDYIDNDLTNFPVLVVIDDTTADKCDGGNSIRFLDVDNTTEYYYEIEKWVDNEDRLVWVNVTSISPSVDTRFLMYYGNNLASDNQNPTDVWDNDFKLVCHLDEIGNTIVDSAIGDDDGTKKGSDEPARSTGKIGYGQDYGTDDYINWGNIGDTFFGMSVWIKPDTTITKDSAIAEFFTAKHQYLNGIFGSCTGLLTDEVCTLMKVLGGDTREGITNDITNDWHLLTIAWNETDERFRLFLDGVLGDMITAGVTPQDTIDGLILGKFDIQVTLAMVLDEFRVFINKERYPEWILASFHTQNQTTGFMSFGSEQTLTESDAPQTINVYPVNESIDITLFPVLGVTVSDVNGDDMIITWHSNLSGSWEIIGSTLSNVYNGTYYQKFTEFVIYGITYYWNTSVTDDQFTTVGNASSFTVESTPSTTSNEGEIGLLGIFGFFSFFLYRKFRKKSSDKK